MKSKKDILKQFKTHYDIAKSGCRNQWKHIQECQAFYAGDYMNYKDQMVYGRGSSSRIKEVQFNFVKPYVNSVVGFIAQQRRKPDYQAVMDNGQDQMAYSDYLNGYSDYVRENTNADQMETMQDKDLVIGGIGVTDTVITIKEGTPTRDPNGEIIVERVDPLSVGYDPLSVHPNLLDSRFAYRVKDYDVNDALELFDADEEDFEVQDPEDNITDYQFNPFGGIQDKIGFEYADPQRKMVRVYFYQWYDIENFYRIENPLLTMNNPELAMALAQKFMEVDVDEEDQMFSFNPSAETLVITKSLRSEIKGIFEEFGIPFNPIAEKRKVFYTAVLSGDKVFTSYKSVSQQGFSLKFKTGDRDEVNNIYTGMVASMRDPQRYYNKSVTEIMLIIANNSRGGVIYEEGAVDNVQEFEAQWARTNAAVKVNDGALSGGKIQPKAQPHMPSGYEGIVDNADNALRKVTGIDESFFGAISGGNETAMLQRQRIKQATTILACYFDNIGLYAKEQARMMLSFMRILAESSNGKMFKTYDDEGNLIFERLSPDFFVDEYEIGIGEAPETAMQKEYYTQTLISMAQSMQAIGDPRYLQFYAAAIKHMPIPERDKKPLIEVLTGQQQIDPALVEQLQQKIQMLEGQASQVQMQKMLADINKTTADTQKTLIDAQKSRAEIESVQEDTEKKAIENDIMAAKGYEDVNVTI